MDPKLLSSQLLELFESLNQLVLGHTKLGFFWIIHDAGSQLKDTARIVTTGNDLGNTSDFLQKSYIFIGIQIDSRS